MEGMTDALNKLQACFMKGSIKSYTRQATPLTKKKWYLRLQSFVHVVTEQRCIVFNVCVLTSVKSLQTYGKPMN